MASLVARYEPGGLELEWKPPLPVPSGGEVPICAVARRKSQRDGARHWLSYAESSRGEQPRRPHPNESAVLSRFAASNGCDEYIEPLTGLARHPFALGIGCPGRSGGASSPTAPDKYNRVGAHVAGRKPPQKIHFCRRGAQCKVFSRTASPRARRPRALHPPAMGGCSAKGPTSIAQRTHENTLH